MNLPPLRLSVYRRLADGHTGRYVGQPELQTVSGARLLARQNSEETGNNLESYYLRRSDYVALFEDSDSQVKETASPPVIDV